MSEARGTFLNILFYFFIYCRLRGVYYCVWALWRLWATLSLRCVGSPYGGISCCRAQALGAWASVAPVLRLKDAGRRSFWSLLFPYKQDINSPWERGIPCSLCIRGWRWCPRTVCWENRGDRGPSASPSGRRGGYLGGARLLESVPSILLLITWLLW